MRLPLALSRRWRHLALYACLAASAGSGGSQDQPFTIVLFPDTQNYHEGSPNFESDVVTTCITAPATTTTYKCQTQWVVANQATRSIRGVIHLGDITNSDGVTSGNARRSWEGVSDAHEILDRANIPYSVVPGNHDHSGDGDVLHRDTKWFQWFFPPSRFQRPWYVDSFPKTFRANQNNAIRLTNAGTNYLVVSLDFAPEKDAACWADSLARALPDHIVIVATHCYQGKGAIRPDSTREFVHQPCAVSYNIVGFDGEDLWNELLALHSNIRLAVSGHVQGGSSYAVRPSLAGGGAVHQMLVDYQEERFDNRKHGAGWIRLLRINPTSRTLQASPISVIGRTAFNARSTSGECDGSNAARCYQNDPAHKDHTFTIDNFDVTTPVLDQHLEPRAFTDRHVNENPAGNQNQSSVAASPNGDFVSVWRDDSEAPSGFYEIFGRSFRRDGCARSIGYRVNQNSHRQQREPDISVDASGRTVIVWADDSRGAEGSYQIYARGMTTEGQQRFFPFTVNQDPSGDQRTPKVASTPDGRFFVTWKDTRDDGGDIFVRGFNADGTQLFNEVRVNQTTQSGTQQTPDISVGSDGRFAVVWRSGNQIRAQSFQANGTPLGALQTVATGATVAAPSIAATPDGNAVIAWRQTTRSIRYKRFSIGGTVPVASVDVKTVNTGALEVPAVAIAPTGEVVVAWQDDTDGNLRWEIYKAAFRDDDAVIASESGTVNKNSRGQQTAPSVAVAGVAPNVRWIVSWTDDLDRNGSTQILARGGSIARVRQLPP